MSEKRRLFELDGLRGIAAIAVCVFHFQLFKYGTTGVDLFFIISGFVIYMTIINAKTIRDFWVSRLIRLYPAYWLSIIIAIISFSVLSHQAISHQFNFILGNITMLQPVFRCKELVDAYWTLYVEMNFYILISVLWAFKQLKNIELILFIGMLSMVAIIVPYQLLDGSSPIYTRFFIVFRGLVPILNHFHLFAAGIVFYLIYSKGINFMRVILLLCSFALIALTHRIGGKVFYFLNLNEHLICCLVFYLVFILTIYHKTLFLKHPLLVILGNISFVLYLIHQSFGIAVSNYLTPSIGAAFSKSLGIAASLILSYLITYYFDIPLRFWLKKKYCLKKKQPIAVLQS